MKFVPDRLEVAVGDRVTWVNRDFVPHTVTSKQAGVESGDLKEKARWSWTAKKPGEISYICRLHPVMNGSIIVK